MPLVAMILKPSRSSRRTAPTTFGLSLSRTETNTVPEVGTGLPAPSWLLAKATG